MPFSAKASMTESELKQLRLNADSLAGCLHSLLEKIESIERGKGIVNEGNGEIEGPLTIATEKRDYTEDTNTEEGYRRIVTKQLKTRSIHAVCLQYPSTSSTSSSHSPSISPSRTVSINNHQLQQIRVEEYSNRLLVTHVDPHANIDIRMGDVIREIDGKVASSLSVLSSLNGTFTLKLQPAAVYEAPAEFYRLLSAIDTSSFNCKSSQVVQVISRQGDMQVVRKVDDLCGVGLISESVKKEAVSLVNALNRNVIVLIGAPSVGRRTLKTLLLQHSPQSFATAIPVTSREQREGELEGREYHYWRKEDILQKIRDKEMVEWGELDNQLYGTWAGHVHEIVKGGRVCVLDSCPQSLPFLYNSIFKPFVVHISPPELDEALELEQLRPRRRNEKDVKECLEKAEGIARDYSNFIHLTLVNRNTDVTFKRLLAAIDDLRIKSQYIPKDWA